MIPLFKPFVPELPELSDVLYSGRLTYGDYTRQFEEKLKEYFNTPYLIVTSSYSNAISVALTTLGLVMGDRVIVSPMACLVSTQPYLSNGMKICWADVDSKTGTLSPDSVRSRLKLGAKAIVHNHFCGYPGYIDEINDIGKEHGIPVIDDGIECFGTEYKGKKIGNCGADATVFSLAAVRFLNCIDGGIVIFKDEKHYRKSLLIRDCGIDRTRFRDELGEIDANCDISLVGYNAMMSNVNGYIGLRQMAFIEDILVVVRKQAVMWDEYFSNHNLYTPLPIRDGLPNYWVYGILAEDKVATIKEFRKKGYYASGVHINNNIYSVFGERDEEMLGVSEFAKHFVALPCGWWMDNEFMSKNQ